MVDHRLITGCSTGFGRELAKLVLERGWRAVVTARDPSKVADMAEGHGAPEAGVVVQRLRYVGSHYAWRGLSRERALTRVDARIPGEQGGGSARGINRAARLSGKRRIDGRQVTVEPGTRQRDPHAFEFAS
jgi:NAD(P)-dependent dehydrogenase (short-subunit alcohol dehydrogenase family)